MYANEAVLVAAGPPMAAAWSAIFIYIQLLMEYRILIHLLIHQMASMALYILLLVSTIIDECAIRKGE